MNKHIVYSLLLLISLYSLQAQDSQFLHAKVAYEYGYYDSVFVYISPKSPKPEYKELCGKTYYATNNYTQALECFSFVQTTESWYYTACIFAINQQVDSALWYLQKHVQSLEKKSYSHIITNTAFNGIAKTYEWREFWKQPYYTELELLAETIEYTIQNKTMQDVLDILETTMLKNDLLTAYKALALAKQGDTKQAQLTIKNVQISTTSARAVYIAYKTYNQLHNFEQAYIWLQRYIQLSPYDMAVYYDIARIAFELQYFDKAKQYLTTLLTYYYAHDSAWYLLSCIYEQQKQYLQALPYLHKACELAPGNAEYLFARANVYLEVKQYKQAEIDYNQSLDLQPQLHVYFNRGQARRMQGNMQGACYDYTRSYKLGNQEALYFKNKYCTHNVK